MSTPPNLSGEIEIRFQETIGRRVLRVARVEDVTPRYRRVVLAGDALDDGFPYVHFAPTDHVKVFFPNPDTGELVLPDGSRPGFGGPEGKPDPIYRDYTVRAWDPDARELTLDFVVHEHGIAGVWARDAKLGDEIGVFGPRGNIVFPSNYPRYIAAGDETALPAIARIVEEAPAGSRVTVVVEVDGPADEQELTGQAEIEILWVYRAMMPPAAGHLSLLETAVRGLAIDPHERVFVFAAGETGALTPIRRYFRRELGLPKAQVDVDGYWKKGVANLDHHNNDLTDDED